MANMINNMGEDFTVVKGMRICQMKIQEAKQFDFEIVGELTETERSAGSFGHTGI